MQVEKIFSKQQPSKVKQMTFLKKNIAFLEILFICIRLALMLYVQLKWDCGRNETQ